MSEYGIYAVGLLAQLLFSTRSLVQWIQSERAGQVLSPTLFWQLSLGASLLLMVYGILRDDLVIILGQSLSYGIYLRNLHYKGAWQPISTSIKLLILFFPLLAMAWLASDASHNWSDIVHNPAISGFMLGWGSAGQLLLTFRFVYQWYHSEKAQQSVLPLGFWFISLAGAGLVIIYGAYRHDPVLLLGQVFGLLVYIRNLMLGLKHQAAAPILRHEQSR